MMPDLRLQLLQRFLVLATLRILPGCHQLLQVALGTDERHKHLFEPGERGVGLLACPVGAELLGGLGGGRGTSSIFLSMKRQRLSRWDLKSSSGWSCSFFILTLLMIKSDVIIFSIPVNRWRVLPLGEEVKAQVLDPDLVLMPPPFPPPFSRVLIN